MTIAGVDEAGRGPLAGPVVAAACVVPLDLDIPGIDDSKKISEVWKYFRINPPFPLFLSSVVAGAAGGCLCHAHHNERRRIWGRRC